MAGKSKKIIEKFAPNIVYLYLFVLVFGQLLRTDRILGISRGVLISDVVVFLSVPLFFLLKTPSNVVFKKAGNLIIFAAFSTFLSYYFLPSSKVVFGSLYLFRLFAYFTFAGVTYVFIQEMRLNKKKVFNSILAAIFFMAIFGFMQYLLVPDLRFLGPLGWDDHVARLAGTFLDPTFIAILLIFGACLAYPAFKNWKQKSYLFLSIFFVVATLLTYARASYLALSGAVLYFFYLRRRLLLGVLGLIALSFIIFNLPSGEGEGVNLFRTKSIYLKIENYKETVQLIKVSPVFGLGFNNICSYREIYFGDSPERHSCTGADSSLLFVMATLGICGFIIFLDFVLAVLKSLDKNVYSQGFKLCFVALLIHSLFVNSLFYGAIIGVMGILWAISAKESK